MAWLKHLLATENFIALLAEDASGTIVGGLTAYELVKFERERSEFTIWQSPRATGGAASPPASSPRCRRLPIAAAPTSFSSKRT